MSRRIAPLRVLDKPPGWDTMPPLARHAHIALATQHQISADWTPHQMRRLAKLLNSGKSYREAARAMRVCEFQARIKQEVLRSEGKLVNQREVFGMGLKDCRSRK